MFTRMDGPQAVQNEVFACQRKTKHTTSLRKVMKCGSIIAKKFSSTCSQVIFEARAGSDCRITDPNKRYSRNLEQGGLEIPCPSFAVTS